MARSIDKRLEALEDLSREQAAAEIRRAWDQLADRDIALIVAPFHFRREPTPEEASVTAAFREVVTEDLLAQAINYNKGLSEEEVSRRLRREVTGPVLQRRRFQVLRHLQSLKEVS